MLREQVPERGQSPLARGQDEAARPAVGAVGAAPTHRWATVEVEVEAQVEAGVEGHPMGVVAEAPVCSCT